MERRSGKKWWENEKHRSLFWSRCYNVQLNSFISVNAASKIAAPFPKAIYLVNPVSEFQRSALKKTSLGWLLLTFKTLASVFGKSTPHSFGRSIAWVILETASDYWYLLTWVTGTLQNSLSTYPTCSWLQFLFDLLQSHGWSKRTKTESPQVW